MDQWWYVALWGFVGGLIPEIMRIIAALRGNTGPTWRELLASLLSACLGLGVLLFDNPPDSALQIAVMGAAFPSLFSGLVAAATKEPTTRGRRRVIDYLAWRF